MNTTDELPEVPEEDYDAGDKCGRCGYARRDHQPTVIEQKMSGIVVRCKKFSDMNARKKK